MLVQKSALRIEVGKRVYEFHLEADSPLGETYDILVKMQCYVADRINQANEIIKKQQEEQAIKDASEAETKTSSETTPETSTETVTHTPTEVAEAVPAESVEVVAAAV